MLRNRIDTSRMRDLVRTITRFASLILTLNPTALGPSCRAPVSKEKLFSRAIFEPTDEELRPPGSPFIKGEQTDEEKPDIFKLMMKKERNGKGKQSNTLETFWKETTLKKRVARLSIDSDGVSAAEDVCKDEHDDMDDFIVYNNGEAGNATLKKMGKRRKDDPESGSEEAASIDVDVVFGPDRSNSPDQIRTLSKLLPSTKMKVCLRIFILHSIC